MSIIVFSAEVAKSFLESTDEFAVSLDDAWIWIGYAKKQNAKEVLFNTFTEGLDFLRSSVKSPTGGRPSELILLTIECFKSLAMMAGTEKGKEVRRYFLDCEKELKALSRPKTGAEFLIMFAQELRELELKQEATDNLLRQQIAQRDEEIRLLKLTISSVDLETQANTCELERFRNGHGYWYSIAGWCKKQGYKLSLEEMKAKGQQATALARIKGLAPQPINDPRWGQVNSYPDTLLDELTW